MHNVQVDNMLAMMEDKLDAEDMAERSRRKVQMHADPQIVGSPTSGWWGIPLAEPWWGRAAQGSISAWSSGQQDCWAFASLLEGGFLARRTAARPCVHSMRVS